MVDPPILRHQRAFNRATRDSWDEFAPHRERVMNLLLARAGGRLLVLGAGNCNDLDLRALCDHFDEIHLADLDHDAVAAGVARQGPTSGVVHVLDRCDVTGIVADLDRFWERAPDESAIDAVIAAARESESPIRGRFDLVLSACVLSQLIDAVVHCIGSAHPRTSAVARAIRDRHIELTLQLTHPGGRVLLVTDMLSTDRVPELSGVSPEQLPSFFETCVAADRCFAGTSPVELESLIGPGARAIERSAPWMWQIGPLGLLVYALAIDLHSGRS